MVKKKLAIVGNGMATCRLLDELVQRQAHHLYEITVYGEEWGGAYNRIQLGKVLGGAPPDSIVTKPPEWYDAHRVRLLSATRVARVDTRRRTVVTDDDQQRGFDVCVLATGSQPLVPPLPGLLGDDGELRPGAFVYRTIGDCLRMRDSTRPGDSAVIVGGGLLGLEAAKVLSDRGLHVTVVHVAPHLMNTQLDFVAGEMLRRQIEASGIFVRAGVGVESVYGEERLHGVVLDDGTTLPADLIVLACGVRPRVDVAKASGLPVNKGIVVNDTLATAVPGVYALGECTEHRGALYGLVAPVWEQAAVLADVLAGTRPQARYRGSKLYSRLKVAGVDVASMGKLEPELDSDEVLQIVEERRNSYRKLVVRDGRILGAMLVGNTSAAATLVQMYDRDEPLPEDPLEILCAGGRGLGAGAAGAASDARIVCNCHQVSERAIRSAIEGGAGTVAALGACTRAGTGCGSCQSELGALLSITSPPAAAAG